MIPQFWKEVKVLNFNQIRIFIGIGFVVCFHWVFFYGSIKLGDSASITLACLGSTSFFSAILEPLVLSKKFSKSDIALGALVLIGVLLIYFSLPPNAVNSKARPQLAVLTGLIAAVLSSTFIVLNKKFITITSSLVISTIEMGSGAALLTLVVPVLYRKDTLWYPHFDPHHLR
jgi:drug/metabolite transporter (DMT)-like permease